MTRAWLAALCLLLAGCGSAGGEEGAADGAASLWITRDRGETVLYAGQVEAGQTVLQALRSQMEVETKYGGRFVQSIDGLEGSLAEGRDWFVYLNGVFADRSAAELRLQDGDVAWWDYGDWEGEQERAVVVGAFPEPFVNGYGGKRRETVVAYEGEDLRAGAEAIARLLGAPAVPLERVRLAGDVNVFYLVPGPPRFQAEADSPGGPYRFTFSGDALALARDPGRYRYRFEVP
ncbi:MAG: DUF4430 domain-containing protein [Gaiellaceae bacterium]